MKRLFFALALLPLLALAAPASADDAGHHDVLDVHRLPLGDGHVSTTPLRGYVMSCRTGPGRGGGARHAGTWIHGDTWDLTEKPHVQGEVRWPDAQFSIQEVQDGGLVTRLIEGNGLPVDTPTGTFPVERDDPAYAIDPNPNSIRAHNFTLKLPAHPQIAASPSCLPMGMIGVALNGVAIFSALDDANRDAVAHEVQDLCNGHPQMAGEYHYHGPSPCLPSETDDEKLIGYALDGFGIFSMYDANGKEMTDADLDACHGRVSTIEWDGQQVKMYHYVLTREYPYTIGCFRGTPVRVPHQGRRRRRFGRRGGPPRGFPPPGGRYGDRPPPPFGRQPM